MKKLLWALLAFVVLAAAGFAVFLARFDADRFRPEVVRRIEEQTGRPARMGKISLGWRRGVALELRDLEVDPGSQPGGEPAAQVQRASVVVKILPLLRGEVQLSSVALIGPRVHVIRTPAGTINVEGLTPPPGKTAAPASAPGSAASPPPPHPASFSVRLFELKDGWLRFTDLSVQPPLNVEVRDLNLDVANLSLTRPADFECRFTLFSGQPNVRAKGRVTPPAAGKPPVLERFRLEMDLARLHVEELTRVFPAMKELGLEEGLEGKLTVAVDRLVLDPKGMASLQAQIRFSGGRIRLARMAVPARELEMEAVAQGGQISLNTLSGKMGEGSFTARGAVKGLPSQPSGTVQGKVENLTLEEVLAPVGQSEPALRGRFSGSFSGDFQGKTWEEIRRTLNGDGEIQLDNGVLSNMNLLREVFDRLTVIPGLTQTLLSRLPDSYQEKLNARDTRLEPFHLTAASRAGVVSLPDLRVTTDSFALSGSGQFDLRGALNLPARVEIEPQLTAALIRSVEELRFLTGDQGRMEIPILVRGNLPKVSVIPDVNAVASQLFSSKGEELVGELLEKVFEKKGNKESGL